MAPSSLRDDLARVFGPDAFAPGLFYAHAPALRFELSRGGTHLDQFVQAFDRAREVAGHLFRDAAEMTAVLAWFAEGPPAGSRGVFRSVRECGVRVGRPRAWWTEVGEEGWGPAVRSLLAFRCGPGDVDRLLWGALAVDVGVRPRLEARLYLADVGRGVLAHPYDDRGMDVVGPNAGLLAGLHRRFGAYLLEHDRARMDAFFGRGPGDGEVGPEGGSV